MESGFHRPARKSGFLFWSRYIHVTVPVRLHCSATANRQSLQVVGIRGLRYAPPETGCPYVGNAASRLPLPREHCGLTRDLGKACGRAPPQEKVMAVTKKLLVIHAKRSKPASIQLGLNVPAISGQTWAGKKCPSPCRWEGLQ